jgi:antitoxin (DNA-binding transcriptional repressor) of toxin-antitoxin stability system
MKVYTYSEARQRLARVLDEARSGGEIRIKRRDGSEFAVRPVVPGRSPLDVPGVDTGLERAEILAAIRESREREPSGGSL